MYDAIVIGAGISGLTAAYSLTRDAAKKVLLLEASNRVGGKIHTNEAHGLRMESGPNTFPGSSESILKLCLDLGILPSSASAEAKKRYILFRKKLRKVPSSPPEILTTDLLGPVGKLRLLMEPFQKKAVSSDESVADFSRRRLGQQVLDNLLGPFLAGIYAGDPELLSMPAVFPKLSQWEQQNGSLFRSIFKQKTNTHNSTGSQLLSFDKGMGRLVEVLQAALPDGTLLLESPVTHITSENGLHLITINNETTIKTRSIIIATPADVAGKLLATIAPEAVTCFEAIQYVPLCVAHLAYQKSDIPEPVNGFGFLVSKSDRRRLLGCVWSSSLFPEKAPNDQHLFSCYVSGRVSSQANSEIVDDLNQEFIKIFKAPHLKPVRYRIVRHEKAIPQYNVGHLNKIATIEESLSHRPGVFLAGNYLHGVSLNSCVKSGMLAADRVSEFITQKRKLHWIYPLQIVNGNLIS